MLRQVGERDRTMRRELQEVMYEERAAKLAIGQLLDSVSWLVCLLSAFFLLVRGVA